VEIYNICSQIKAIYKENNITLWNEYYPTRNHLYNDLLTGNLYVYTINSEVVGAISIGKDLIEGEKLPEGVASLSRLMVRPDLQNNGIGGKILTGIEDVLINRGIFEIRFLVSINNQRAMRLYRRLGYNNHGYYPTPWEDDGYYLLFRKKI